MFSTGHLIFLIVSLAVIVTGTILCKRYVPDINLMLKICLVIGIVSEVIKMFSVVNLVISSCIVLLGVSSFIFGLHIDPHITIFRFLTVASFTLNDSPIGRLKPSAIRKGTWFISVYADIILSLILSGTIEKDMIPYFFLDVRNNP